MPVTVYLQRPPCTTLEAILFESTKENRLLRDMLFKKEETDVPFQVQFPPAAVFATYHSDERVALKRLNRVPAGDLNRDFNEPRHSRAAVTGVDPLMLKPCGTQRGLTQSIKECKLFAQNRQRNCAPCSFVFPVSHSSLWKFTGS